MLVKVKLLDWFYLKKKIVFAMGKYIVLISILKCVSNLADDVDYLAAMLSLTDLDFDDVVSLRDKKCSFYENLNNFVKENEDSEISLKIKSGFCVVKWSKMEINEDKGQW